MAIFITIVTLIFVVVVVIVWNIEPGFRQGVEKYLLIPIFRLVEYYSNLNNDGGGGGNGGGSGGSNSSISVNATQQSFTFTHPTTLAAASTNATADLKIF